MILWVEWGHSYGSNFYIVIFTERLLFRNHLTRKVETYVEVSSVMYIQVCSVHIPGDSVGPQLGSKFYIGIYRIKSIKIFFSETDRPQKVEICVEAFCCIVDCSLLKSRSSGIVCSFNGGPIFT